MLNYASVLRETPQSEPIPGKDMAQNNAGGYSFAIDKWQQLHRFLILGTEGGSYYASQQKLTLENAQNVLSCILEDGQRVVSLLTEISVKARAPKNDMALFVLALCASVEDADTRKAALTALPLVVRTGTHLFQFMKFIKTANMRGNGPGLLKAICRWYEDKPADKLAYQLLKYKQREGFSHRDMLRMARPKTTDSIHNQLYRYAVKGEVPEFPQIQAAEQLKTASLKEAASLIIKHKIPREAVPTQMLNIPAIWMALLQDMPMTAMVRNLAKMSSIDLIKPLSDASRKIATTLRDEKLIRESKIHPIQVLTAMMTYAQGKGEKGALVWTPDPNIIDALNEAFYLSIGNVTPTHKRLMLGIDVSGSMTMGSVAGVSGLTPRIAAAAMAMLTARVEPNKFLMGFSEEFIPLDISPSHRMDQIIRHMSGFPFSLTDCSLPMRYALAKGLGVDAFIVYTDSETQYGRIHPVQALQQYRQKTGIPAKLIVVGMVSNQFSIADPDDAGMLDVVGFDTAVPELISTFITDSV